MSLQIFPPHRFTPKPWSGGTTTELFIDPPTAKYSELNFNLRLSTATVRVEHSTFTSLAGVNRQLLVLDGQITLQHKNRHSITLNRGDIDVFKGDWNTTCIGRCTDFNVMTTGNTKTSLSSITLERESSWHPTPEEGLKTIAIYVYEGQLSLEHKTKTNKINEGSLIIFDVKENSNFQLKSLEPSMLVVVTIF
ncbi:HutD/Ves family protein [Formosa haliotis]|uniref:HutD/Ves family protein n=1 Tax=Formosa haliotis TaxID=1555194 RepID=UPI0008241863|nr:HutD family protein [Formosa haliotis]